MANTKYTVSEYNAIINEYIIKCINTEPYEVKLDTDKEKLQFLWDTFIKEFYHPTELKREGNMTKVFRNWLQGLPSAFELEWRNYEITQLAISWGSLPQQATDKEVSKLLDGYWLFIANKVMVLMDRKNINKTI